MTQTKANFTFGTNTKRRQSAALLWKRAFTDLSAIAEKYSKMQECLQREAWTIWWLALVTFWTDRTCTKKKKRKRLSFCKNSKTPACQQVSLASSIPAGGPLSVIWSWLAFLSNTGAGGIWQVTSAHFFSSPLFLCLYMYVCVSRKQSDKQHPDLTDGALRPVFLALLPEPVTPAALLWGGRQSRPQPILVPEETQ